MSETIIFIKKYKPFVLGYCNCGCKKIIPIRNKMGNIQRFLMGHSNLEGLKFYKGRNHSKYKGGYTKKGDYIAIYRPKHPNCSKDGYVLLHRYLKELDIGRYLTKQEEIHHIDNNKGNNEPSNLQILSKAEHTTISRTKGDVKIKDRVCNICKGKTYVNKKGWEYWNYRDGVYICQNCYKKERKILSAAVIK